jgi:hypothetical protein
MKRFSNWLARWVLWVPILFAEGPDSGELFIGMAATAVAVGLAPMGVGCVLFFEPGQTWLVGWGIVSFCLIWYMLVGLCAYVLLPCNSNYGHWSERGAW